jgi:hypothetical protein
MKIIMALLLFCSSPAFAQRRYTPSDIPKMQRLNDPVGSGWRYDAGATSGNYNGTTYSEINLGLSYQLNKWMVWRNAAFQRFGSDRDTVTGLDTSLRLGTRMDSNSSNFGIDMYAGPGLRFASDSYNSYFAEAGIGFKFFGIYAGIGAKYMQYMKAREENGVTLPKNDQQVFIAIGGGGNL